MRTTVEVNDELMRAVKKQAADEHSTLREVFDRALRQYFSAKPPAGGFKLRWKAHKRGVLQPGVVLEDRDSLFEAMEGRR
jgi:hypothetical protein